MSGGKRIAAGSRRSSPAPALLKLLYPPKCVLCRRIIREKDALLCPDCRRNLPLLRTVEVIHPGLICSAAFYYEEPLRSAFLRYKFEGCDFYAPLFGGYMAGAARMQLSGPFDLVTWAPLSRKRLRQRGYDQARLLAECAAEEYRLPLVPALEKVRDTAPQSSLSGTAREENARGAYALLPGAEVGGKRILLVDDILTTGSTLGACAAVLLEAGAAEVSCAVLARHKPEEAGTADPPEREHA